MSENNEKLSEADLETLANKLVELADASAFNYTAPGSANLLNKLIEAQEGLQAILNMMAFDKLTDYRFQSVLRFIHAVGCDLDNFSEATGQIAINFLLDTLLTAKSTRSRQVALALLEEILSWCFPHKKEAIDNQLLSFLFDEDAMMRYSMLNYVTDYQIKDAIPHLIILLNTSEDGFVYEILQALKKINSPEALLVLEEWEKNQKGKA